MKVRTRELLALGWVKAFHFRHTYYYKIAVNNCDNWLYIVAHTDPVSSKQIFGKPAVGNLLVYDGKVFLEFGP